MRLWRLRPRDLTATFLVALAAVYFGLFEAGVHVPELGSVRAVSAVVLFLGLAACAVGADPSLFKPRPVVGFLIATQRASGYAALAVGLVAVVLGSEAMLTVLFVITVALWMSATLRHLTREPIPSRPSRPAKSASRPGGVHV